MDNLPAPKDANASPLRRALSACRGAFLSAGFFSLFINLLLLTPAIYMLQVYDRVLSSSSQSTLLMLTLITVFLFLILGGLEWVRAQILIISGSRLDNLLGARIFDNIHAQTVRSGGAVASAQPLGDLLQLRQFLTGQGLFAFFDAPWLPIYLAVMYLFHPLIGVAGTVAALVLVALAIWNEAATRDDLKEANRTAMESDNYTQRNLRNAEVIEVMGMQPSMRARWQNKQSTLLALQARASRRGGLISTTSKTFRQASQTLILGLGAYLAIERQISPGIVIAGSILLGRALAPIDQLISSWRNFLSARGAYQRLEELLSKGADRDEPMPLPEPRGEVTLESVVIKPPGASAPILTDINLRLEPGTLLAVIGPSAAGKSTLVRAILGLYRPAAGSVRLDGAALDQWDRAALGPFIGYLPQDVELLDGSVSENIARFGEVDAEEVVAAAKAAGVHEMILRLPDGYETKVVGRVLSAGQRQRIGLARALYRNPRLIVLDEPNSNLDKDGDAALVHTLQELRGSGRTVILVTHRSNLLAHVDKVLVLNEGRVATFGDRDQVLAPRQATQRPAVAIARHPAAVRAGADGEPPR